MVQIVAGQVGSILMREKSGEKIELGDLLVVDDAEGYLIIQVYDLLYGSQISRLSREQLSGLKLEGLGAGLEFFEPQLRNYIIAQGKAVLRVSSETQPPKVLPDFFGTVRHVEAKDLLLQTLDFVHRFETHPGEEIFIGCPMSSR